MSKSPAYVSPQVWPWHWRYILPKCFVWIVWLTFAEGFRKAANVVLFTLSSKTVASVEVSSLVKLDHLDVFSITEANLLAVLCKERYVCSLSHQWNSSCPPSLTMRMGWQSGMIKNVKGHSLGTSLVVQWLRLLHTMQVAWVPSLVGELRYHTSSYIFFFGQKNPKHKISNIVTHSIKTFKKILKEKKKTFPQPLFPDSGNGDATWYAVSQHLLPCNLHIPFWLSNFPSGNSLLQEIL